MKISKYIQIQFLCIMLGIKIYYLIKQIYFYYILTRSKFMNKNKEGQKGKNKPRYAPKQPSDTYRHNNNRQENYQKKKYPIDDQIYRQQRKEPVHVKKKYVQKSSLKEDAANSSKVVQKEENHFAYKQNYQKYQSKQQYKPVENNYLVRNQKSYVQQAQKFKEREQETKKNYNNPKPQYRKIQKEDNNKKHIKAQQYKVFPQSKKVYRQREPDERQVYSKAQTNYRAQIKEEQKNVEKERQFNQQKKYENQQIENQQKSNKESIIDKEAEQDEIYTIPKREKMRDNYLQQNKRKEYSKNPKHHEDFQQQHNKIELQLIGLEDKCKKIKKLLLSDLPNITQLKIYASKLQPTLYFEYFEPNNKQKKIKKHFTQILRDSQKLKQKRSLFQQVFERAFLKLDKKYYNISVFLIEIAKIRDIKITKRSIFNLDQGHDVMFYYMKGKQNTINFVVFDCFMRSIRASCKDIEDLSRKHPDEYKIYLNFKKKIFEQEQQGQVVDLLDNQQAQSDEDSRPNFQERSIQELKTQLYRIIDKNIEDIQNNIQQLNNQLLKEALNDTNSEKYKILEERIDDLQSGFDMFINTRNTFLDQLAQNVNSKEFHKKYLKKMIIAEKQLESGLPIIGKKRIILQMLKKKNLVVIEGETGSGKSTQLPQILCEFYELFDNPNAKPVLVTQPRRLATRSLAQRVAKQIGEVVGGFVDYVASAGKKVSNDAKIIFKLDRIVLDQLTQDPVLSKYSCLVIDEAHQRTISIDVILGLIKKLLEQRKDFKIIVTSASMDIKLFQNYFKTKTLKVSGRMYPVTIIHKDFKNFYEGDKYQNVRKIEKVINEEILSPSGDSMKSEYKGHLLCFCSQIDEINKLVQIYEKKLNKRMFEVFALHGKITPGQQKKVFEELGKHKIIFANRIAETAITIDGVKVVIDPGNDVQLVYDQKFKYSSMKMQEITKSSAKQRAGRAGRTAPGYCFRLYSQTNFNARPINKVPQIQNSSLQTVVLRLKTLRIRDVINFEYISPPNKEGLQTSLKLLTLIGALKPITQEVTKIGNLIIKIPIDPFLSRAIVESLMFQKFLKAYNSKRYINLPQKQRVLLQTRGLANTIISILSLVINFSNLFYVKKQERQEGEKMKYYEFSDQEGDFFFLENIYQKFIKLKQKGQNKLRQDNNYKNRQLSTWIRDSYLNFKAMNQTEDLIKEISTIISDFDLNLSQYEDEIDKIKSKLKQCKTFREVILSCLITSFSANICKYSKNSHIGYTMVSQRKPLLIYGTSNLNLLGKQPQWIVCYDLYTNETGRLYCKLAHQVSYQFMKTHLDTFVWQLFDIQGIQIKSPFYKEQILQFPTLFINKFKKDYNQSQKNERFAFLKDSYPEIVEQKGRITFFLQLGTSQKINKKIQNEFDEALQKYQVSVINQSMNQYRHNYIGNVYVTLYDGFKIQKIEFDNREFLLETTGPTDIIQQMAVDCQYYGPFTIQQTDKNRDLRKRQGTGLVTYQDRRKLKLTIFSLAQKDQFEKYFLIMRSHGHHLQLKQTIIDKRRKIPKTKIYMYFFAGTSQEKKLYAHYEFRSNDIYSARNMVEFIKEGIIKAKMQNSFNPKLNTRDVQATKKGNGINIYTSCDEYEIAQDLFKMDKAGLLGTFFKMPLFIKKFREPEINEASKTNEQWKTQLYTLFEKSKIKTQNITINIRGIYRPDKSKGPLSEFQKTFRVDMTAQIITLDSNVLQRLKNNYDGKVKVIGCQKVHVRAKYDQLLATASYKAFESLRDQYELQVQRFKHQSPLLIIEAIVRLIRGHQKVMIYAHSPNREDFVKPLRIISSMFTPKLVKLTEAQFRFLDKIKEGSQILDQIQIKYNYKIYFGFDRWTTTLKVYCHDNEIKDIENNIKEQIAKYKYFCEKISYRGKNLNKVKQILDNYLNINVNPLMTYEIKFQFREVLVTGDLDTVEFIKNQILKLVNSGKEECIICADIMKTPYKLICGCSFCCMCLTEHIRAYRNSSGTELFRCPKDDCKSGINIYDVKNLLSEQQFNKMCDVRINKYLQANKQKYIACNYCENVFDREQVEAAGEINCQICGKSECLKCKSSHPNYTCEEWKQRDTLNLQKLGIKKCPQCSTGITKNGGCNHMECRNCKAHICWKCLKFFGTSKECYDHLAKYCGGIFDPNDIY